MTRGGLLLLLACAQPPTPALDALRRHHGALTLAEEDPARAFDLCAAIGDLALARDCRQAAARALARLDPQATAARCAALPADEGAECFFILADRTEDPAHCARAGPFAPECRTHTLAARLTREQPTPETVEGIMARILHGPLYPADQATLWLTAWRMVKPGVAPGEDLCAHARGEVSRAACEEARLSP